MSALLRTVERLINEDWHVCRMSELNKGDIFRLREPTGELVNDSKGDQIWIATSAPYQTINENGEATWGVEVKGENDNE